MRARLNDFKTNLAKKQSSFKSFSPFKFYRNGLSIKKVKGFKTKIREALNKTLKKHRTTRIFLILMSKWFFIGYLLFKFLIKVMVIYLIYKRSYN
jgi:hypothetical protein